jgi:hypothetical protein
LYDFLKIKNMKKTIKILVEKMNQLQQNRDGTLQGGFATIKGGFKRLDDDFQTNERGCTNTKDCSHDTNILASCTNTGTCIM